MNIFFSGSHERNNRFFWSEETDCTNKFNHAIKHLNKRMQGCQSNSCNTFLKIMWYINQTYMKSLAQPMFFGYFSFSGSHERNNCWRYRGASISWQLLFINRTAHECYAVTSHFVLAREQGMLDLASVHLNTNSILKGL